MGHAKYEHSTYFLLYKIMNYGNLLTDKQNKVDKVISKTLHGP